MAGDIQEPVRLTFQVDSLHSDSISFGRFELESLSWERRSSFSHNRYLEEVEKYVRPGSVTEKKAYLEAHFRRRALLSLASLDSSQAEKEGSSCENGSYDAVNSEENNKEDQCSAEEPQHIHLVTDACHFDESSSDGYYCDGDVNGGESEATANAVDVHIVSHFDEISTGESDSHHGEFEATAHSDTRLEPAENSVDMENVVRSCNGEEKLEGKSQCNDALMYGIEHEVEVKTKPTGQAPELPREENVSQCTEAMDSALQIFQTRAPKARAEDKTRAAGTRPRPRPRPQSRTSLTRRPEVKTGTAQSSGWRETQTPLRTRIPKQMPQLNGSSLQSSIRIPKKPSPQSSNAKPPQEIRSEKEPRPKRGVTLQPSTPERTESRRHPSAAGIKQQISSTNRETKRCTLNSSFRSERGEKMEEIKKSAMTSSCRSDRGEKIRQGKKDAETRQPAKEPNFKAKPMPSFYHVSKNKPRVVPNSSRSSKAPSKSLRLGNQTVTGSISCSKTKNDPLVSQSKTEGAHASLGRRNCDLRANFEARGSSNTRNHAAKATQPKAVAQRK